MGGNNDGEVIPGGFPRDVVDCVRKTELNSEKNVAMVPRKLSSKTFELQAIRMNQLVFKGTCRKSRQVKLLFYSY